MATVYNANELVPAVKQLFSEMERHNGAVSLLSNLFMPDESPSQDESAETRPLTPDEATSQDGSDVPDLIDQIFGETDKKVDFSDAKRISDTLDRTGLELRRADSGVTIISNYDDNYDFVEYSIGVSDWDKFLGFLGTLDPEQVKESGLEKHLEALAEVSLEEMADTLGPKRPEEEMRRLFEGMEGMIERYKELGMGAAQSVGELEDYLWHAKHGDLTEYMLIENEGLLLEVDDEDNERYSPANWQKRCADPEVLRDNWYFALDMLEKTGPDFNPNAQELHQQLAAHLSKCVEIAIGYMNSHKARSVYNKETVGEMREILVDARNEMRRLCPSDAVYGIPLRCTSPVRLTSP
jgi:hypothetical protein